MLKRGAALSAVATACALALVLLLRGPAYHVSLTVSNASFDSFDCANAGGGTEKAPPCKVQQPLEFQGRRTAYPHVEAER